MLHRMLTDVPEDAPEEGERCFGGCFQGELEEEERRCDAVFK